MLGDASAEEGEGEGGAQDVDCEIYWDLRRWDGVGGCKEEVVRCAGEDSECGHIQVWELVNSLLLGE